MSYDKFDEKAGRTFRITADWSNKGDSRIHQLGTPYILAQTIRDKYPQVEAITQISGPLGDVILRYRNTAFKETDAFCAEPSFFDVFSFPLIQGDPETSLEDPNMMILTRSSAQKYFGDENPVGKTMGYRPWARSSFFRSPA